MKLIKALISFYNYSSLGVPVKYLTNSKVLQKMDINGQLMETNVILYLVARLIQKVLRIITFSLEVTDTLGQMVDSPMGPQAEHFLTLRENLSI
ncbi:MAG: hypothetical protein MZV64_29140 [Ignavibacteriales bacterium]|nr:hypothetical protein [Ignavibacteriales bacterium]